MSRLAPLALSAMASLLLLLSPLGCGTGGRDAHDIAADFEGTVSQAMAERLARDVDLAHAPVVISVGREPEVRFDEGDQQALEDYLRDVVSALEGDRIRVAQQVVEDSGARSQRLTLTLAVEHQGQTRYVPVEIHLEREGRRMVITRVRVMANVTMPFSQSVSGLNSCCNLRLLRPLRHPWNARCQRPHSSSSSIGAERRIGSNPALCA